MVSKKRALTLSDSTSSTTIVFDIDGTLVDVTKSYLWTILETSRLYCEKILGWENTPPHTEWFTQNHVNDLKKLKGFNSDYVCATALIIFILDNVEITPTLPKDPSPPICPGSYAAYLNKSVSEIQEAWKLYIRSFSDSPNDLPLTKLQNSPHKPFVLDEGSLLEKNYIERLFQEIYLGDQFEGFYGTSRLFYEGEGKYKKEELLIPPTLLAELKERNFELGIYTGRPREDLDLALDYFNLRGYFPPHLMISLTDSLESGSNGKPDPWGLLELKKRLPESIHYIFVGDSVDDMSAAHSAGWVGLFYGQNETHQFQTEKTLALPNWENWWPLLQSVIRK